MTYIVSVNELSFCRLLLLVVLRRTIWILSVDSYLPPFNGRLRAAVAWLERRALVRPIEDFDPTIRDLYSDVYRSLLYDVFGRSEGWQRKYFRMDDVADAVPGYEDAYRCIATNFLGQREPIVLALCILEERLGRQNLKLIGVTPAVKGVADILAGRPPMAHGARWLAVALNMLLAALALLHSIVTSLRRVRFSEQLSLEIFAAVDYVGDPGESELLAEFSNLGPVVLVRRKRTPVTQALEVDRAYEFLSVTNGWLRLSQLPKLVKELCADTSRMMSKAAAIEPRLFYQLCSLLQYKVLYRALLNRIRPKIYWGRDIYNPDHFIRRNELHRIGARAWGVNHSYSSYSYGYPAYRYCGFDRFYLMGRVLYDRFYRETWPSDIEIATATHFRLSRELLSVRFVPRPNDILIMCSTFMNERAMINLVRGLAMAFPERKILLQVKGTAQPLLLVEMSNFVEECTSGLANVLVTKESVYELFKRVRYAFSDPATVVAEAIQFGLYTFFTDVSAIQRNSYFREYDGLSVSSAAEAENRVRGIESGSWHYPVEQYEDLVDLSGIGFADRIRMDLGLPVRESARRVWNVAAGH